MADFILLAGISEYNDKYLKNLRLAHRDAQNLHGLFRHGLGFGENAILLPADVSLRDFNRSLNAIGEQLSADDRFVFYFSGHGYQHGDDQYLLLADAEKAEVEAGRISMQEVISLQTLKARIERWPVRQTLFILDTCRQALSAGTHHGAETPYQGTPLLGRMFARSPALGPELHDGKATASCRSVILNACSDGDYAWEPEEGDTSVLVKAFESAIAVPLRRGESIRIDAQTPNLLRQHIVRYFGEAHPQTPWLSPSDSSFELRRADHIEPAPPTPALTEASCTPDNWDLDERKWRLTCLKNTAEAYEAYLHTALLGSPHIEEAFKRIEDLLAPTDMPAPTAQSDPPTTSEPPPLPRQPPFEVTREALKPRIPAPGTVFSDADFAPEMVVIPQGEFWMGSPEDEVGRYSNEGPLHKVTIGYSFAVGKYPVMQAEWEAVMGGNPSYFKNNPRNPVEQVSWDDANAYIKKLIEKTGQNYRLLSEAEWEYCCRAGTTTAFNTGSTITTDQANFNGSSKVLRLFEIGTYRKTTTPCNQFSANAFGLYDMHGNVLEWVEDFYHNTYLGAPQDGSPWVTEGEREYRLMRGGVWNLHQLVARSAFRGKGANDTYNGVGFRVARTLP